MTLRITVVTGVSDPLAGLLWSTYLEAGGTPPTHVLRIKGKKRRSSLQSLLEATTLFGPGPLLQLAYKHGRGGDITGEGLSLERLFHSRATQVSDHDSVAGEAGLALLNDAAPDVLVSVGCPEILPPSHLAIPRLTALNLHNGRLPDYRGLIATFWELMEGETQGCVTLHVMQEEVDRGPILAQAEVPLLGQRTMLPLLRQKKRIGGQLLAQALSDPVAALEEAKPPPPGPGRYWGWPSARQVLTLAWRLRSGHPGEQ